MSCILHIETSTKVCSVAVTEDGAVLFEKVDKSGPSHAVQLGVFVDEAISYIDNHGIPFDTIQHIVGFPSSHRHVIKRLRRLFGCEFRGCSHFLRLIRQFHCL